MGYTMLLDTGSSTLALCNGTIRDGDFIPSAVPMPSGQPGGFEMCNSYGGSCRNESCHGFLAAGFEGSLQMDWGAGSVGINYFVMERRSGERGNACGAPTAASQQQGSPRMDGIFGFAGKGLNMACVGRYSLCDYASGVHTCAGDVEPLPSPWPSTLKERFGSEVFGIEWSGRGGRLFGPGSGSLFAGSAATQQLATQYASVEGQVSAGMKFNSQFYNVMFSGWSLSSANGTQLEGAYPEDTGVQYYAIVDSGTPYVFMPLSLAEVLERHFAAQAEPVWLDIESRQAGQ